MHVFYLQSVNFIFIGGCLGYHQILVFFYQALFLFARCHRKTPKQVFLILCTGGNVLLDATGEKVKLADFGTAIWCDGYQQDNSPRGTEAFMAPEVNMSCSCSHKRLVFSNPSFVFRLSKPFVLVVVYM